MKPQLRKVIKKSGRKHLSNKIFESNISKTTKMNHSIVHKDRNNASNLEVQFTTRFYKIKATIGFM